MLLIFLTCPRAKYFFQFAQQKQACICSFETRFFQFSLNSTLFLIPNCILYSPFELIIIPSRAKSDAAAHRVRVEAPRALERRYSLGDLDEWEMVSSRTDSSLDNEDRSDSTSFMLSDEMFPFGIRVSRRHTRSMSALRRKRFRECTRSLTDLSVYSAVSAASVRATFGELAKASTVSHGGAEGVTAGDLPSLLNAIEEEDRRIVKACKEKQRLLKEYEDLLKLADPKATHTCSGLSQGVECNNELLAGILHTLKSNLSDEPAQTLELPTTQVIDYLLALNSQLTLLLVRLFFSTFFTTFLVSLYYPLQTKSSFAKRFL